jgi:hypothetical protein
MTADRQTNQAGSGKPRDHQTGPRLLVYVEATSRPFEFKYTEYQQAHDLYMDRADSQCMVVVHVDETRQRLHGA